MGMERSKDDIISQLHKALLHQTRVSEFWREQAMMLLERDVDIAIYGASKINWCFLHGFMTQDYASVPLEIVGDENAITLKKGDGFDAWMSDETGVIGPDGKVPMGVMNRQKLHEAVDAWLDGVEFK